MYECICCGKRFRIPRGYAGQREEYFGFPVREAVAGCPLCGGSYERYTDVRRRE